MRREKEDKPRNTSLLEKLRRFRSDVRGVGAVEFALIAPLLLGLYITSFELTIGLSMSKRVTRTASTVADLITRMSGVSKTDLATMVDVSNAIFTPYTPQDLVMKITGVKVDPSGNSTVAWSWDASGATPYTAGAAVNVPTDMRSPNTFLVRAEVAVNHKLLMFMPGLMPSRLQTITLRREFFYRQRVGTTLSCSDC
jgi:Flp pilus assembly protein TadG